MRTVSGEPRYCRDIRIHLYADLTRRRAASVCARVCVGMRMCARVCAHVRVSIRSRARVAAVCRCWRRRQFDGGGRQRDCGMTCAVTSEKREGREGEKRKEKKVEQEID